MNAGLAIQGASGTAGNFSTLPLPIHLPMNPPIYYTPVLTVRATSDSAPRICNPPLANQWLTNRIKVNQSKSKLAAKAATHPGFHAMHILDFQRDPTGSHPIPVDPTSRRVKVSPSKSNLSRRTGFLPVSIFSASGSTFWEPLGLNRACWDLNKQSFLKFAKNLCPSMNPSVPQSVRPPTSRRMRISPTEKRCRKMQFSPRIWHAL